MAAAGAFFVTVSCVICGYHVYKEVWNPSIGEAFVCFAKEENSHGRIAVAVICAEGYVVGNLPCEISGLCFNFIKHGGEINGELLVNSNSDRCLLLFSLVRSTCSGDGGGSS